MENMKKNAALAAAELIKPNMIVGLGTGSTASFFIQALIEKNINIKCIASSEKSKELAKKGLHLIDSDKVEYLDIYVDGVDEITNKKDMIKGAGGAFLKEKILAHSAKQFVIIADENKQVDRLGKKPIPLEVFHFSAFCTKKLILEKNLGDFRKENGKYFITENGNYIFDVINKNFNIQSFDTELIKIPGVLSTGLFYDLNPLVIIAKKDGTITSF